MVTESDIDQSTLQAYIETEYLVHGESVFTLRIGQVSADLLDAYKRENVNCCAFLTACNPHSLSLDDDENTTRHNDLANELDRRGFKFVAGVGQHPSNAWPGEESFLIFGLSLASAKELGLRLEQNAFVWTGEEAAPQLILLR